MVGGEDDRLSGTGSRHGGPDAGRRTRGCSLTPLAVTAHADALGIQPGLAARLLAEAGLYLWHRVGHRQARTLFEHALAICEAARATTSPDTAHSLRHLATILRAQGDLNGARTLHKRALAIRETRLDPNHPGMVRSQEALAAVVAALDNQQPFNGL